MTPITKYCGSSSVFAGVSSSVSDGQFSVGGNTLVQTLANIIEPEHGVVSDLVCGSVGMFVQSSHFI